MAQKMIRPTERPRHYIGRSNKTPVNTDSIEAMTKERDRMVNGTFVNIEAPGQSAFICCQYYPGMPIFSQHLMHETKYKIPLSVVRHINERCVYDKHSYLLDEKGEPIKQGKKEPRYKFIPDYEQ